MDHDRSLHLLLAAAGLVAGVIICHFTGLSWWWALVIAAAVAAAPLLPLAWTDAVDTSGDIDP